MRRFTLLSFALLLYVFFIYQVNAYGGDMSNNTIAIKIRIKCDNQVTIIALYDNPVSRDFASLLPVTVTFQDYAKTEKITNLPRKLTVNGGLTSNDNEGDFTYYAPWGNLAVFYKGFGKARGLYILGRIESGKEWLADMTEDFTARIESMENL